MSLPICMLRMLIPEMDTNLSVPMPFANLTVGSAGNTKRGLGGGRDVKNRLLLFFFSLRVRARRESGEMNSGHS